MAANSLKLKKTFLKKRLAPGLSFDKGGKNWQVFLGETKSNFLNLTKRKLKRVACGRCWCLTGVERLGPTLRTLGFFYFQKKKKAEKSAPVAGPSKRPPTSPPLKKVAGFAGTRNLKFPGLSGWWSVQERAPGWSSRNKKKKKKKKNKESKKITVSWVVLKKKKKPGPTPALPLLSSSFGWGRKGRGFFGGGFKSNPPLSVGKKISNKRSPHRKVAKFFLKKTPPPQLGKFFRVNSFSEGQGFRDLFVFPFSPLVKPNLAGLGSGWKAPRPVGP